MTEPLTDYYVQKVPDKCDRITWRGSYYALPELAGDNVLPELAGDNVPAKYVKVPNRPGILFCLHGTSSISAYESLLEEYQQLGDDLSDVIADFAGLKDRIQLALDFA